VPVHTGTATLYTRWGDWFPASLAVLVFLLGAWSFAWPRRR
jgi:apolipoprotein N-acyltransferase